MPGVTLICCDEATKKRCLFVLYEDDYDDDITNVAYLKRIDAVLKLGCIQQINSVHGLLLCIKLIMFITSCDDTAMLSSFFQLT